ncbi:MAG: glycosyl hydrolase, partial [Deltaproteobacteria bacterium]
MERHGFMKAIIATLSLLIFSACLVGAKGGLESGFNNPPAQAKPHVYWFWMSGNITREGITADLEAMAEAGIGGALIFNTGESHGTEVPPGPVDYMSDQWLNLFKFAVTEAGRLGLTLGANN